MPTGVNQLAYVLKADLNCSEFRWGAADPLLAVIHYDSTQDAAGDCCAAAFQPGLCPFGVRSVELVPFATFPLYPHEPT
jgi:hypothetical protein